MSAMVGGPSEQKDATAEIQTLVDQVRADFESKAGKNYNQVTAISYKSQVVAGTNYFIKVQVSEEDFAHLRVFQPLPHTGQGPELHSFQTGKSAADALEYF